MKVKNEIEIYELDDTEVSSANRIHIGIDSHWNSNDRIVLVVAGKRYTVIAEDLRKAITNATNHKD